MLDADVMRWQVTASADPLLFGKLTEVRAIVEPAAARLAAERATAADLELIEQALRGMAEAGSDTVEMTLADVAFHRCLLLATHNEFLGQIGRVLEVGLAERDRVVHEADPSDDPVPSHRAVFEAIAARDAMAAEAAMLGLLDKSTTDLTRAGLRPDRPVPGTEFNRTGRVPMIESR